jgi:hypothetical protein
MITMNFLQWFQAILIGLKVCGFISASWFIVLLPLEIELGLMFLVYGFVLLAYRNKK